MHQGDRACPGSKIEITATWFHKTKYTSCDLKTLALHYCSPPSKKTLGDVEISWLTSISEPGQLQLLVTEDIWQGIKQLTRKNQVTHFTSISYHFPGCSFDSLPTSEEAVESNPSPFSPSLC